MMKSIKKWVFNNSIRKHPNVHFNKSGGVNKGDKILLIGNYDNIKALEEFAEYFRKSGKKTKLLVYSSKNIEGASNTYSAKDLNWAGVPKSDIIEKRLSGTFDICIFLDKSFQAHYKYILSLLMAELVIGPNIKELSEHFDLIIESRDGNIDKYFEQVKMNLKLLSQ